MIHVITQKKLSKSEQNYGHKLLITSEKKDCKEKEAEGFEPLIGVKSKSSLVCPLTLATTHDDLLDFRSNFCAVLMTKFTSKN